MSDDTNIMNDKLEDYNKEIITEIDLYQ